MPSSKRSPRPSLDCSSYVCDHWGKWDSYSALQKAAKGCGPCCIVRDGFRMCFSARYERVCDDKDRLDDDICAQFPLDGKLPGQVTSFQLRSLHRRHRDPYGSDEYLKEARTASSAIQARCGNMIMECVVVLRAGNPFAVSRGWRSNSSYERQFF
jgi:hypothetical protein